MPRKLHPNLKTWFDSRLLGPAPLPFVEPRDPVKMLLLTACAAIGITEVGADNHGELVELFQSTISKPSGQPWCMAFIQSCVAYVESFGFSSKLFPSEHCLTVWTNSECRRPIEPVAGDLVIYQADGSTRGHTGLITAVHVREFDTVEGNTGPAMGVIEREGDGVYSKVRPKGGLAHMKELGFLRLFEPVGQ